MSAYHVEIAPGAERDIQEAFLWYVERNRLMADAFRAEVFDSIDRVGTSPLGKAADTAGLPGAARKVTAPGFQPGFFALNTRPVQPCAACSTFQPLQARATGRGAHWG